MKPVSPIAKGYEAQEIVYAKDQPEYQPLPALPVNDVAGTIITRWKLTWRERLAILFGRDVFLNVMTFGTPLQPVSLFIGKTPLHEEPAI
jgi:hypothetical protein